MVFGGRLAHDEKGKVVLGEDTRTACQIAVDLCKHEGSTSLIVATAGIPKDKKWGKIWMGYSMVDYMKSICASLTYRHQNATRFNTFAEAKALAKVMPCLFSWHNISPTDEVVIIAKRWHAQRAKMDCVFWFSRAGLEIPIRCETFESPASVWTRIIREQLATINDRRKMLSDRYLDTD